MACCRRRRWSRRPSRWPRPRSAVRPRSPCSAAPGRRPVLAGCAVLLALLAGYAAWVVRRGRGGPCGCSRAPLPMTGWVGVRAAALAALALAGAASAGPAARPRAARRPARRGGAGLPALAAARGHARPRDPPEVPDDLPDQRADPVLGRHPPARPRRVRAGPPGARAGGRPAAGRAAAGKRRRPGWPGWRRRTGRCAALPQRGLPDLHRGAGEAAAAGPVLALYPAPGPAGPPPAGPITVHTGQAGALRAVRRGRHPVRGAGRSGGAGRCGRTGRLPRGVARPAGPRRRHRPEPSGDRPVDTVPARRAGRPGRPLPPGRRRTVGRAVRGAPCCRPAPRSGTAAGMAVLGVFPAARRAYADGYDIYGQLPDVRERPRLLARLRAEPGLRRRLRHLGAGAGFHKSDGTTWTLRPNQCYSGSYDGWLWRYEGACGSCACHVERRCHDGYRRTSAGWVRSICRWTTDCGCPGAVGWPTVRRGQSGPVRDLRPAPAQRPRRRR